MGYGESDAAPSVEGHPRREAVVQPTGRITVLVVDDNPVNLRLISWILEDLEFEVVTVLDGQAALEACSTREFSFVLMDCQMPGMDGLTATAALRERERVSGRHAIVIGHSAGCDEDTCLAAGMDDFLPKPLDAVEMQNKLKQLYRTHAA